MDIRWYKEWKKDHPDASFAEAKAVYEEICYKNIIRWTKELGWGNAVHEVPEGKIELLGATCFAENFLCNCKLMLEHFPLDTVKNFVLEYPVSFSMDSAHFRGLIQDIIWTLPDLWKEVILHQLKKDGAILRRMTWVPLCGKEAWDGELEELKIYAEKMN